MECKRTNDVTKIQNLILRLRIRWRGIHTSKKKRERESCRLSKDDDAGGKAGVKESKRQQLLSTFIEINTSS